MPALLSGIVITSFGKRKLVALFFVGCVQSIVRYCLDCLQSSQSIYSLYTPLAVTVSVFIKNHHQAVEYGFALKRKK